MFGDKRRPPLARTLGIFAGRPHRDCAWSRRRGRQKLRALDDVSVELLIEPNDPDVRILEAKTFYRLDEDPTEFLFLRGASSTERVDMNVCFNVRLALGRSD